MPHHAVEITLTRPASPRELDHAGRLTPLAANHDHTHLLALTEAKTPHRALNRLRHTLNETLPIDVLATHYPDTHGKITLNVAFTPTTDAAVRRAAAQHGQPAEAFVEHSLAQALERLDREETERLKRAMHALLSTTTRDHLLTAVARALATPRPSR
ncbi:hypothetical protein RB196_34505 [Streptomyces sp. PmtA]|uniref:hypothetical protein n=1 Tax=Streptomyces sp. PmtA TaxID=3074275 RepID=UPI00301446E4